MIEQERVEAKSAKRARGQGVNNGVTSGSLPGGAIFAETVQDIIGAMVAAAGGTYDDVTGAITLPGSSGLAGTSTVTVAANRIEHSETVSAAGVLPTSKIIASLAPHDDADENDAEMLDIAALSALAGTDQITFELAFFAPTQGAVKLNWSAI